MVFLRKLCPRRKRKQHDSRKDDSDNEASALPCDCDQCQSFHLHRRPHSPAGRHSRKAKHQNCCPYCDHKRLTPSFKRRLLKKWPKSSQAETTSPELQTTTSSSEEVICASEVYPISSQEKLPAPDSASAVSADINANKIPSDLEGRKQNAEKFEFQDIYEGETSTSSGQGSSSLAHANTQTSDFSIPKSPKESATSSDREGKPEEQPSQPQQRAVRFEYGLYVKAPDKDNPSPEDTAASHPPSGKNSGSERPSYSSNTLIIAHKESYSSTHQGAEVPLRFAIPVDNNEVYQCVNQGSSKMFFVYKLVDDSPEQSSSSQEVTPNLIYLEDLHILEQQSHSNPNASPTVSDAPSHKGSYPFQEDPNISEAPYSNKSQSSQQQTPEQTTGFPTINPNTATTPEANNSEDEPLVSDAKPIQISKQSIKAFKSLFIRTVPMEKSGSESELNSTSSEKNDQQVNNDTSVQDSATSQEPEEKASSGSINKNDKKGYVSENNRSKLTTCVKCNYCTHVPVNSCPSKVKQKKSSVRGIFSRSKKKTSDNKSVCVFTSHLSNVSKRSTNSSNGTKDKSLLPIPFCYWFEVIDDK